MIAAGLCTLSCTEHMRGPDENDNVRETVPITLSVSAVGTDSRSIITSSALHEGAEIGISLTGSDGTYDGTLYSNVRFIADGTASDQTWTSETDVMVSASPATLHAYYPYSDEVTDLSRIPVETASQTDYLYALPASDINNRNADVNISMQHALAAMKFTVSRGTYTGPGSITAITVQGENIATEGILNAVSGEITDLAGKGEAISLPLNEASLGTSGTGIYMMAIPTGRSTGIAIVLTIDGEEFSINTDPVMLSKGTVAAIDITINNSNVTVAPVRIKQWEEGAAVSSEFSRNWTVNLIGDTDGISFTNSLDADGNLTITASPEYPDAEINPVKGISGQATMTEQIDPETGTRTIVLSGISSDIDIEFDSWCLWVTTEYEVTDISSDTRLLYMKSYPDRTQCTRMKVDGTEVTPANHYRFSSLGKHTVKFTFPKKTVIPTSCFYYNDNLTSARIPEGVTELSTQAFYFCRRLKTVELPQSLTKAGYDVFVNSVSLTSIELPANLQMSYNLLKNCTALEQVTLPENLKLLPSGTVTGCTSLRQIGIPQSVSTIESNAFSGSGITSLTIPPKITSIPNDMCYKCGSLETVHLPESLTEINHRAFMSCNSLSTISFGNSSSTQGQLVIPEGIRKIGYTAFNGCDMLTSVTVPSTLTDIGYGAFTGKNITSVSVSAENVKYGKIGDFNGIVEKDTGVLIFGCSNATTVPAGVTKIGDYAYYTMPIPEIDLHEGVTYIGDYAFYETNTLKKIISRAMVPPALGTQGVFNIPCTYGKIYVHQEAADDYESAWLSNEEASFLKFYNWGIGHIENL